MYKVEYVSIQSIFFNIFLENIYGLKAVTCVTHKLSGTMTEINVYTTVKLKEGILWAV